MEPVGGAEERIAEGRKRRTKVSRQSHANLNAKERGFDPISVLLAASEGRVRQLLHIKYGRMKVSPFAFYRGAVAIMAADLARLPNSGLLAQLCGDAHVQNLGSFAAPDGKLVFNISDFDETIRGPWEWDVKRMAASLVLAGRECGHSRGVCRSAAEVCGSAYCRTMAEFAREPLLRVARHQVHREDRVGPVREAFRQSQRAHPLDLLKKLTEPGPHGEPRFRDLRPLSWRIQGPAAKQVLGSLEMYRANLAPERQHLFDLLRQIDVGFKVVGTGSVGLRDYVVLFEGNGPSDPIFLQIKQEAPSAYAKYLPKQPVQHQGRRVADGQRAIQTLSDIMLGWTTIGPHEYLVRQLNDHKGSVDIQSLRGQGLESLAELAGELLARGHARSGDACRIRGYCGSGVKMIRALTDFASQYADQTEADYERFLAAIKAGKIRAA